MNIEEIQKSYGRCLLANKDVSLFDRFYDVFLESQPSFKQMFANTDFERQKRLLKAGVNMMLMYAKDNGAVMGLNDIQKTHSHAYLNIKPELYGYWKNSLIKVIEEYDNQFNPVLKAHWNQALDQGIDYIKSGYNKFD